MGSPIAPGTTAPLATQPAQIVNVSPNARATYQAAASFALPALATDVAYLIGSATKIVHITRLQIGIVATAAAQGKVVVAKCSTAPTGGTATTLTNVPLDSQFAAATAVAKVYTALPTVGTLVGNIKSYPYYFAASADGAPQILDIDFLPYYPSKQGLILRGAAQCVAVNLAGVTYAGGTMHVSWEWTEAESYVQI